MTPSPDRTDIRMWGAIIERGPRQYSIIVTGVATNSHTTVGVTDFRRDIAASLADAESRRDAMLRSVEAEVLARGDRVVSFERVLWDVPGLR